ncbi:MAG: restriction endonuclease subunit S [Spirochaetia bacterium]|jgi:type I restriction enzyme S subunit|nr:restriction endonuclease subunit S [Spirochaetia bacterium]
MRRLLKDIAVIGAGQGAPQGDSNYCDNGTPFIKAGNLQELIEGKDINDIQQVSENVAKEHRLKIYPRGTILFAKSGMSCMKGYVYVLPQDAYVVSHLACITPNEDCSEYLRYYFTFHKPNQLVKDAAYPSISLSDIGDLEIDMKSVSERTDIVNQLKHIESIISLRQEELSALDELIKARFVELFGDARVNPNKYDTIPFIDIVDYMGDIGSNGANKVVVDHLDMKDEEDYAMMVRFTNFTKNDFTNDVKYVSKEAYDFFKKSQIFGGELIICKIGSAGQNYVMPYLNRPVSLGLNQIMVRIKENILMPYLYQYLHTNYGEFLISGCVNGAVTKTITKTELKKIPVMLPPMELQKEFADFVKQVDKSKVVVQKAQEETQMLFDSLMQEYFG